MKRLPHLSARVHTIALSSALLGLVVVGCFAFSSAPPLRSQVTQKTSLKNRVLVAERDRVRALEFNPAAPKFDVVWESVPTGMPARAQGIGEIRLADVDHDGNNELVGIDPLGIFVWGKHGQHPDYYNFDSSMVERSLTQILPIDIDNDSEIEFVTQGIQRYLSRSRVITMWKLVQKQLRKISELRLPGDMSWTITYGDCDNDDQPELVSSSDLVHIFKWVPKKGLVEQANFADIASLVEKCTRCTGRFTRRA